MARVVIKVEKDGTFTMDAQNFTGGACKAATAALSAKFAGARMEEKDKPELYMFETEGVAAEMQQ